MIYSERVHESKERQGSPRRTPRRLPREPSAAAEPPLPLILEDGAAYQVNEILDSRRHVGLLEYLVDWESYSPEERSWVLRHDILDPSLLDTFHATGSTCSPWKRTTTTSSGSLALRSWPWKGGFCHKHARLHRHPVTVHSLTRILITHTCSPSAPHHYWDKSTPLTSVSCPVSLMSKGLYMGISTTSLFNSSVLLLYSTPACFFSIPLQRFFPVSVHHRLNASYQPSLCVHSVTEHLPIHYQLTSKTKDSICGHYSSY
ncbi:uncharacterized protein LOC122871610 [Siniperca chuatsi]|uniref:uncharacterized protein LOC122871610 n=1 Tax=Siniperca chuatsi TaxID=119488 RepID=UPI001CE19378|nr:uncharacterized protein LOC122871610 [Siniperca chuatsi]